MGDIAIRAEGLSKQYHIGGQQTHDKLSDQLADMFVAPFRRAGKLLRGQAAGAAELDEAIWALKDVSFEIKPGEVVGIIGRNGAGKSTLLKILSRITEPTEGYAEIYGRVGSLLEVGTGFHPELTGRENVYLNGAILGMKKVEIERKFDEIVAFAEIDKFIDTPVKHYSSGMYVRLAFSVAAYLEPEILLVDEVLAVGDMAFQKKCLGKMENVANQGRTVLFVSHNMGAITRLCERSFWLDEGRIESEGLSRQVVSRYESQYLMACAQWKRPYSEKAGGEFAFLSIVVRNSEGRPCTLFSGDEPVSVEIRYVVHRPLSGCQIGTRLWNSNGFVVFTTTDADNSGVSALPKEQGSYRAVFMIPGNFLSPGTYYLSVAAHLPNRCTYEVIEQAAVFELSPSASLASLDGRLGIVAPLVHWETCKESLI
jgi:lipopolysaccharide transport system ATP-binding protein